jgi:glyoxylase-like metal-dependent hydrolase (beta-lactamase superfamily II)
MELWSGSGYRIYKTNTHRCACYVVEKDKARVLIDTSMRFDRNAIIASLRSMGIRNIDAIFLTHSHTDHVSNAKYFSDLYRCPVFASLKGLDNIKRGQCRMPRGTQALSRFICSMEPKLPFYDFTSFEACPDVAELNNNAVHCLLGDAVAVLETPGHTDDSVSFLISNCIAIVGDAMVNAFGNYYPPFADDEQGVKASWEKLLDGGYQWFYPSHGNPVSRNDLLKAYHKIRAF